MTRTPLIYAGIGSRKTPIGIRALMQLMATRLAEQGHILRSGGAPGADQAFEKGCDIVDGKKEIFIPWNGFQNRNARTEVGVLAGVDPRALELASKIHPNWADCDEPVRRLHARNCYQILGVNLDTPVSDVVCWTPGGKGGGGTGQALRLARKLGIPIWDLGHDPTYLRFLQMMGLPHVD